MTNNSQRLLEQLKRSLYARRIDEVVATGVANRSPFQNQRSSMSSITANVARRVTPTPSQSTSSVSPAPQNLPANARRDMPGFKPLTEPSGEDLYRTPGSQSSAPAAKPDQTPQRAADNPSPRPPSMSMGLGGGLRPVGSSVGQPSTASTAAPKPAAPRPATPTPAAPAQPSRSSQMFQAYSDKGDDATSADFFRADRQAQAERKAAPAPTASRPAPAAPQKPQQSNADYMRSSGMMDEANLERKIRKMLEQKSAKFNPVAADYQDSSGPNKPVGKSEKEQHHGVDEEILQELGPNRRRKRNRFKTTLGTLEKRNWGGNQSTKGRYSEEHTLSEARKAAFAKVNSKKKGRTDTGKPADIVDTEPKLNRMTGY